MSKNDKSTKKVEETKDVDKKEKENVKGKNKKKFNFLKFFAIFIFITITLSVILVSSYVIKTIKDAPDIDPKNINALLDETSVIYDEDGKLIEKIQTEEYRTIVKIDKVPESLQNAFIAIEDERFEKHFGVDPRGIMSSLIDNIKAGKTVRGASTITQQLARNLYLTSEKKLDRKVKEAYLAMQLERSLTKEQILEAYLNRIYLGQGAYGVQEASQTYFSKDVDQLTLAESATLAGIVKSPTRFSIYKTIKAADFNEDENIKVGDLDILGEKYVAVYNQEAVDRQRIVLKKMLELGFIDKNEYDKAINENIAEALNPGQKKVLGISSYFNDLVKTEALELLINELGYTKEQAETELYTGGLKIYSSLDLEAQKKLENIYDNFTEVLLGNTDSIYGPAFVSWRLDQNRNVLDENGNIIFFAKDNILTEDLDLHVNNGTFELNEDGSLKIFSPKVVTYNKQIVLRDYYTIDDRKNLITHKLGNLDLPEDAFSIEDDHILIKSDFLNSNKNFYRISDNNNLIISKDYYYNDLTGTVQPQSASVLIDYRTGQVKALVGGREAKGAKILNRALTPRQPGSTIKPLAAYLPALEQGYTAASPIDDIPFVNEAGDIWPSNWYKGYKGITTMRKAIEQSINVSSVKTVQAIGIPTSVEYLKKMGIVDPDPKKNTFVDREQGPNNDENLSALGLGGMTKGISPLKITGAFGSIANNGVYKEPTTIVKIIDRNGKTLIENKPASNQVASPQNAYIMADMLRTTVSNGIAGRARIPNMTTAGKTGTTQDKSDAWFAGFTPYYVMATWIGNDNPQIKLNQGSSVAAQLWRIIMTQMHEDLENKDFDMPDGIEKVQVCSQSGKLPGEHCAHDQRGSTIITELFSTSNKPSQTCDVHVVQEVDTSTNMLANQYCPSYLIGSKVFVKTARPYNPADYDGIVPDDYRFRLPSLYCNVHKKGVIQEIIDDIIKPDDEDIEDENSENDENDNSTNENGNNNQNSQENNSTNENENSNQDTDTNNENE